jgi:hypothetical protein
MKLTITAIAAMFSLLMLITPGRASADPGNWQPPAIQQVGDYQLRNVGFWSGRPIACHNRYFRRHHRYECR